MSAINVGILDVTSKNGFRGMSFLMDNLSSSVLAAQAGATGLTASLHRVTLSSAATASFILKQMLNKEAPIIAIVVNDSANSINVYPTVGETMNGSTNAAQAIAAGATGIFVHTNTNGVKDWRANTIT